MAKKLGVGPGCHVVAFDAPSNYRELLAPLPPDVAFGVRAGTKTDLVHVFVTEASELAKRLQALRGTLRPEVPVWVSWPKRASKVPTTVTEDVIREVALPLGYVDIKVCAVSEVWSGLKLVVRRELR